MRTSWLLVLVLVGCAAEPDESPPRDGTLHVDISVERGSSPPSEPDADVCSLASELPLDDICSLMCDPSAMAARMALDGSDAGTCYQLYCTLPDQEHVLVGVCLPP